MKYLALLLILFAAFFTAIAEESSEVSTNATAEVSTNAIPEVNTNAPQGEIPEDLLDMADKYEGDTRIFLVKDDEIERRGGEFFVFKFHTFQDDRHPKHFDNYRLRVTVQLKDRKTRDIIFCHHEEDVMVRPESLMKDYDGTEWEFEIPFGQLEKLRLNAYAIEFGFEQDGYFVPLSVDYEDVDSADEILKGEGTKVEMERTLKNILIGR